MGKRFSEIAFLKIHVLFEKGKCALSLKSGFSSVHQGRLSEEDPSKVWFPDKVRSSLVLRNSDLSKAIRLANGFGHIIDDCAVCHSGSDK